MIVGVGVRREADALEHGPGLLHVDALVAQVERIGEHVDGMAREGHDQYQREQELARRGTQSVPSPNRRGLSWCCRQWARAHRHLVPPRLAVRQRLTALTVQMECLH